MKNYLPNNTVISALENKPTINLVYKMATILVAITIAFSAGVMNPIELKSATITIYNQTDFDNFVKNVNGGKNYSGDVINLNVPVTATVPIGTETNYFRGTFNGNCHKIELQMDYPTRNGVALFARTENATIQNVFVAGSVKGISWAAGIVANCNNTTIRNSTNIANIATYPGGNNGVAGGIVAYSWWGATIEGCTNAGTIKTAWQSGGIIGIGFLALTVKNCTNVGSISADWGGVGGIVGEMGYVDNSDYNGRSTVEYCMNAGYVSSVRYNAGGIVAKDNGYHNAIRYCLNVGVVYGTDIKDDTTSTKNKPGSASTTGAILGRRSTVSGGNTQVSYCFYDRQMFYSQAKQANPTSLSPNNTLWYTAIGGVADNNTAGIQGFNTTGMLGSQLQSAGLGSSYWSYTSNAYPTLRSGGGNCSCNELLHNVAGSPLILKNKIPSAVVPNTVNYVDTMYTCEHMPNVYWRASNLNVGHNYGRYRQDTVYIYANCSQMADPIQKKIPIKIGKDPNNNNTPNNGFYFKLANSQDNVENYFAFTVSEIMPTIATGDNASFNVSTTEEGNLTVNIVNAAGTKVMDVETSFISANTDNRININNLSALATGTYYVVVNFNDQIVMRKFIKQ